MSALTTTGNTAGQDRPTSSLRGVASLEEARLWLNERGIEDIECMAPDQAGVARGKLMPGD